MAAPAGNLQGSIEQDQADAQGPVFASPAVRLAT